MKSSSTSFLTLAVATALSFSSTTRADPLKKAELTQIINEVGIIQPGQGERPAAVNDVVEGKLGVRTGQKSRAELVFADETLTRLGANTIFNFEDGSRNMDLNQGTILLQVPKNAGGATIRTAAVTAAVTGTTILFEHTPAPVVPDKLKKSEKQRRRNAHGYVKAMVLEGHLKVWLKGKLGESILLGPGQMLIMADDGLTIPEPVDFDVETVMETSKLLDRQLWIGRKRKLSETLIAQEIFEQRKRKRTGDLIETNLFINDRGTTVIIGDTDERQYVRDSQPQVETTPPEPLQTPGPDRTPPTTDPTPRPTPKPTPPPPENDLGGIVFSGSTGIFGENGNGGFDGTIDGNATVVQSLVDQNGGSNIVPTSGKTFGVLSTGGSAPNGDPLTGVYGTKLLSEPLGNVSGTGERTFLEFDYRFLTNESGIPPNGHYDQALISLTSSDGSSISYFLTVGEIKDGDGGLRPLASANVGGFLAGTDWLTLKLDVTPFLTAPDGTLSISLLDLDTNDVDSALTIDRFQFTKESLVPANSDLIGSYTANFPNGVTFGSGRGEYRIPALRGRENTAATGPGSDGGRFEGVTDTGDLIVNGQIIADTGPNKGTTDGGFGGLVNLRSTSGAVQVNSRVQVASNDPVTRRVSGGGGFITITSGRTGGTGVTISNTGELLSLLNAANSFGGGKISITTGDSNVLVNGGKVIAELGEVDIRTPGTNSQITMNNAQVRGDVVKIGALGTNGQLNINGGQFSADTTLKLYAGGSNGSINFTGNTQLNGTATAKIIAAQTVTIQNGVTVQVSGPSASVYTSNPNYTGSGGNSTTTGAFTGSGAQTISPSVTPPPPFD